MQASRLFLKSSLTIYATTGNPRLLSSEEPILELSEVEGDWLDVRDSVGRRLGATIGDSEGVELGAVVGTAVTH